MYRMAPSSLLAAALVVLQVGAECPTGCPKKCPLPDEFQSDFVKKNFSLDAFWGVYYELAKHDSTQPCYDIPLLGKHVCVYCVRSVKRMNPDKRTYKDLFSIKVFRDTDAICDLEFNITDRPGAFLGHWRSSSWFNPGLENIRNTVVDVGHEANGTYSWSLEFQCRDDESGINFAAVNFYHRNPLVDTSVLQEMESRLKASGLGWIMTTTPGLQLIDQAACAGGRTQYPPIDSKPAWCGQSALKSLALGEGAELVV